jgi:hypothetical protein
LFDGNKEKAIEYKLIVYKYYEFNRNRNKQKQAKAWILSVDPKYFDKPVKVKKKKKKSKKNIKKMKFLITMTIKSLLIMKNLLLLPAAMEVGL